MNEIYGNGSAALQHALVLHNLIFILTKRQRLILSVFFSSVGVAILISFLMSPVYQSSAQILVEREVDSEKALLFRMDLNSRGEYYDWLNAEPAIIHSYSVAKRVVRALHLDKTANTSQIAANDSVSLEKTIIAFRKNLTVENPKKSNVIDITYEAKSPQLAAAVVNEVISTYINYRSEIYDETESFRFFEKQIHLLEDRLRELEQGQAEFKQREDVLSPTEQRAILLTRLAEYEKSLTAVRTDRVGKEAKIAVIKQQLRKGQTLNIPTTEASDSPSREKHIAKLKGDLLDMEVQRERLLQRFTPQYEEVVNLDHQIAATKAQVQNEIQQIVKMEEISISAFKAEEDALQSSIRDVQDEMRAFAQKEFEFTQLSRGIDDKREVYSMLLKQREEAKISLAKMQRGVKIKVISPAVTLPDPIRPKKTLYITISILCGLFGGLSLALVVEYLDRTLKTLRSIKALGGTGKFAELPRLVSPEAHPDEPKGNGQDSIN